MLLNEEKLVVKWLSQYQALKHQQIIKMLSDKDPDVAEKIIRNLQRQQIICTRQDGYLSLDPLADVDDRMITAIWVLLKFIKKISPKAHYPAMYPSQIYFLKDNTGYEIVVLQEGDEHLTKLLRVETDLKYIFVLPRSDMLNEVILPNAPCLFAIIGDSSEDDPEIIFTNKEALE